MKTESASGSSRLILSAITLTLVLVGSYIYNYNHLYQNLEIKFKEVKKIEYGESNYKAEQLIEKAKGEEVIVKKDIDPTKLGKQEVVIEVKTDQVSKVFSYDVKVEDTKAPEISLKEEAISLTQGEEVDILSNIVSVKDTADGKIDYKDENEGTSFYTYETDLNTNKPGTYDVKVTAIDSSNNVSETTYQIVVKEKPVVVNKPIVKNTEVTNKNTNYQNDKTPVIDTSSLSSVAYSLIGAPYRSGGNTPLGFDCSGFVQYVYSQIGISISRSSRSQQYEGVAVSTDSMLPGDIIIWSSNGITPTHSSIYVGGGIMVHATNPRQGVIASNVWAWNNSSRDKIIAVRRI